MEVELDELIKQKKQQNKPQRGNRGRDNRSRDRRRDRDGDVDMGSERGPGRRQQGRQRKPRRDGPYSRSNYNTTGDASQNWKHDLYNKKEDEIEETGWGSKRSKEDREDLLRGTTVLVDNIHYEISEEELKNVFIEKVGSVRSATIFYDRSGRSKGQGKVIFDKYSDAETAVGLSGEKLKGKVIEVTIQEVQPRRNQRQSQEKEITFTVTNRRRSPSPTRITFVNTKARR